MAKYYVVKMNVFAFETKEQAANFADKALDLLTDMPEMEGLGGSAIVVEEDENDQQA